ncbi:DUF368 domain-containing protein [Phycisphaeraceae bacterium D3-23]
MSDASCESDKAPPQAIEPSGASADPLPALAVRGGLGGVLMGLANLVPGISGGTMLLAAGVYPHFIAAIGEVTTFKFKKHSLVVLGSVVVAAALAILLLAGTVKGLVVEHRWVMYSLFIGLTLGGVPVVWRLIRTSSANHLADSRVGRVVWVGAAVGFIAMAALALFQSSGAAGDTQRDGFVFLFLAGIAGASAMILPGVSGGYLLLVLGVYVPILAGVDAFKDGLKAKDTAVILDVGMAVVLPVGLGVLVGVVGVSNLLRWLLQHYEKATLGVLLGLLVGAVVGLWPFQQTATPVEGQLVKGQAVMRVEDDSVGNPMTAQMLGRWVYADSGEPIDAEDLPTAYFAPTAPQIGGALGLIVLGLSATLLIDRLQGRTEKP